MLGMCVYWSITPEMSKKPSCCKIHLVKHGKLGPNFESIEMYKIFFQADVFIYGGL